MEAGYGNYQVQDNHISTGHRIQCSAKFSLQHSKFFIFLFYLNVILILYKSFSLKIDLIKEKKYENFRINNLASIGC